MNSKLLLTISASLVLIFSWAMYQSRLDSTFNKDVEVHSSDEKKEEQESFSGAGKSLDSWSMARSYPSEKIQTRKLSESHQIKQRLVSTEATNRSAWQPMGPQNFAGRILTITVDPNNPTTLYAGAGSGGLWKSTDDGANWNYVTTGFPVLGVSSIVVNPDDSNEIFIGTGEVYGDFNPDDADPNQGTGQGYTIRFRRGTYGLGILKTSDGGLTWSYSLDWSQAGELKGVNVMRMSPFDSDIIYAGTTDGLFRSTNGGDTWDNILNLPNVMSIAMHPANVGTMLVGVGTFGSTGSGVYRSEDGENFSLLTTLPEYTGKTMLDFSKSNPNIAFASVANFDESIGLFRSDDTGVNWAMVNDFDLAKYQGWYSHDVAINPNNFSKLLAGGINVYRSINNGNNLIAESDWFLWNLSAFPIEGPEQPLGDFIHADIHDIVYHPTIPNKVYVASDGGVFKSFNDGLDFVSANTGLQTAQFYQKFSSSMTDENFAIGGLQDNATAVYHGDLAWSRVIGGDGFGTIIDPNDDRNVWGSLYYLRLYFSEDKAQTFPNNAGELSYCLGVNPQNCFCNFSAPICFAPSSARKRVYGATNMVYKIEDGYTSTVTNGGVPLDGDNHVNCLATSHQDEDLVFAGTAPIYTSPAKLFKSANGGDSWTEITNGLPDRFPMEIQVAPCDDNIVYVVFGGYDLTHHLYRSEDGGTTWTGLGTDLPDVPTNAIFIDPENTNHIYIGNDVGVFASTDNGATWMSYATGLPDAVLVMSLSFTPVTRKLRVATHGNGVYETDLLHTQQPYISQTSNLAEWYEEDFQADFTDEPSACVFKHCFYTVRDFDGTDWRGNNQRGFLSEDFNQATLNNEWTAAQGTWNVVNGELQQTNANNTNTQLNIALNQSAASSFFYHWKMKIDGNGTEKRAGVHIFADDLTQDFRGNSYLINFMESSDIVRIYKTDASGNYEILKSVNWTIQPSVWFDCKVVFDPNSGQFSVFINDELVVYFTDENPLTNGNGFSLRSGEAIVSFDDFTIYKGRDCSGGENIIVATDGDCRFESPDDDTFVCGIQSVNFSNMKGWTTPDESQVKIGEHTISVQGKIFTAENEAVKNVDVILENGVSSTALTDDLGVYNFEVMQGNSFDIRPERLDGIKNGVNTFDMVKIRRHILGLEVFDSPYKYIAADVNKSGGVTALDMVKIQLVILLLETEFPNNTSWRFVPTGFVFSNPIDLNNISEKIAINQITAPRDDADFVAIKVGDVNSSANLFQDNQQADTRTNEYVKLLLENKNLKVGEELTIPFLTKDFKQITGYQLTFDFDKTALEFVEAFPNTLTDFPKEKFGTSKIENGKILMNWVSGEAVNIADETELFNLVFRIKKETKLKEVLKISDLELRSEAYNEREDFLRIDLEFFETPQNIFSNITFTPNPFVEKTQLNLESEAAANADIIFYNESGQVLKTQKVSLEKGFNSISFDFFEKEFHGIIFYHIKSEGGSGVGKLLKI